MSVRQHLSRRPSPRLLAVGASILIALVCAVWSVSTVSLLPPKATPRNFETAGVKTSVLVDYPHPVLDDTGVAGNVWNFDVHSLISRAALLSRLAATSSALGYIAHDAGIPADQIAAVAPVTVPVRTELIDAGSEERARELLLAGDRYRLEIQSRIDAPIIDIYAQAPSPAQATRLADATISGLRTYLDVLGAGRRVAPAAQVRLEQLGQPHGGVLNSGAKVKVAGLTFVFAFLVSLLALRALARRRSAPKQPPPASLEPDPRPRPHLAPAPRAAVTLTAMRPVHLLGTPGPLVPSSSAGALAVEPWRFELPSVRRIARTAGDWPRTTRALPWLLAVFIAVLWLVPFDSIALRVSLPVDVKFDRMILPVVAIAWLLSLAKGGPDAPRIRVTKIHVAVGIFVALAFVSVLVNATSLNQTLELDTSIKQLPLLIAYLSVFFMMASSIRPAEVRPFLTFTLVLAVICALGVILEWRTQYNVFFDIAGKVLPGSVFKIASIYTGYDHSGRVVVHGPTMHGLAAASILSMAIAIAVTRIMDAKRPRERILYTLVAGILMVAVLGTQKKTGLIAPAAALLALGFFRRRDLLRMAPIAIILFILLLIVSPGTVDPVIKQFSPSQLGAAAPATTSDRASRYDAIRPDVYSHLLVGRGYGSYQPLGHRIMDSELLLRLIETGVLGLIAYLWIGFSVIATARRTIHARHPLRSPPALAGVAAAAVLVVVSALFDSISFPQVPYVFLYLAAMVAVVVKAPDTEADDAFARR